MPGPVALGRVENCLVRGFVCCFLPYKHIWMGKIWQIHGHLPNFNGAKVSLHTVAECICILPGHSFLSFVIIPKLLLDKTETSIAHPS